MPRRKSTTPPPLNILPANRSPVDLLLAHELRPQAAWCPQCLPQDRRFRPQSHRVREQRRLGVFGVDDCRIEFG
jgi:hypothetical protein